MYFRAKQSISAIVSQNSSQRVVSAENSAFSTQSHANVEGIDRIHQNQPSAIFGIVTHVILGI
jgi:hypothetical protein